MFVTPRSDAAEGRGDVPSINHRVRDDTGTVKRFFFVIDVIGRRHEVAFADVWPSIAADLVSDICNIKVIIFPGPLRAVLMLC